MVSIDNVCILLNDIVYTNESMQNALLKVRSSTVVLLVMEHAIDHWYLVQGFVEQVVLVQEEK